MSEVSDDGSPVEAAPADARSARPFAIPELCLVALIGASGSGKSTFAARHFLPTEVISSDVCRGLVADDPNDQGASEDAFNTVDALYTAVRNRDEKRVGECEQRLRGYRDAGKLPPAAADELDAIIQKAKSGSWDGATERLYEFMLAQRREGVLEPRHHEPDKKAKPAKGKGK